MTSEGRSSDSKAAPGGRGRALVVGAAAVAVMVAGAGFLLVQNRDPVGAEASLSAGSEVSEEGLSAVTDPFTAPLEPASKRPAALPPPDMDRLMAQAATMEDVVVPPSGDRPGFTYRTPDPGDSDYEDYQEMLRHPEIARFVHEKPIYYDPEWRSQFTGRREVAVNDLRLQDGVEDVEQLLRFVVLALAENDRQALDRLRVNRDEYQLIMWPEFPQSRPFLRIPADEAWTFQVAKMRRGVEKALLALGKKPLEFVSFSVTSADEYTNFRLLEFPVVTVQDADTGEYRELDTVEAVVECRGKYKVFMYTD